MLACLAAGCGGETRTVATAPPEIDFTYVDREAPRAPAGWKMTSNTPSGMTFAYTPSWRSSEAGVATGPDGTSCAGDTRRRDKAVDVESPTTSYVRGFEATGARPVEVRIERYPDRDLGRFELVAEGERAPSGSLAVGAFPRADRLWCAVKDPADFRRHRATFERIIATLALPED